MAARNWFKRNFPSPTDLVEWPGTSGREQVLHWVWRKSNLFCFFFAVLKVHIETQKKKMRHFDRFSDKFVLFLTFFPEKSITMILRQRPTDQKKWCDREPNQKNVFFQRLLNFFPRKNESRIRFSHLKNVLKNIALASQCASTIRYCLNILHLPSLGRSQRFFEFIRISVFVFVVLSCILSSVSWVFRPLYAIW